MTEGREGREGRDGEGKGADRERRARRLEDEEDREDGRRGGWQTEEEDKKGERPPPRGAPADPRPVSRRSPDVEATGESSSLEWLGAPWQRGREARSLPLREEWPSDPPFLVVSLRALHGARVSPRTP